MRVAFLLAVVGLSGLAASAPSFPLPFRRALSVQRTLAEQGLRGRKIPDLLIAAAAEISGAQLLHYDQDFDHIATVTGQSCRWVVPRGSVD